MKRLVCFLFFVSSALAHMCGGEALPAAGSADGAFFNTTLRPTLHPLPFAGEEKCAGSI